MKVLMIIHSLHYSGAPKIFLWLARMLAQDSDNKISVMTLYKNTEYKEKPIDNIEISDLDWERSIPRKILYVHKKIKDEQYDACVSFGLIGNIVSTIACLRTHAKSVICERSNPFQKRFSKERFVKPLFSLANGAVFQLPQIADFYSNIKNTVVIPNPVFKPARATDNFLNKQKKIVFVGRIDNFQKRIDVLLYAFKIFVSNYQDYVLELYGNGPDHDFVKLKIDELGLKNNVRLCGVTKVPLEVMTKARLFVMTSDFEGIPNSLIEAMSIGLPCISTNCSPGGAAFLIQNKVNGFLVEKQDSEGVAQIMNFLVENPHIADKVGHEALKINDTYSETKIVDMWKTYLSALINE